jgi:ribosome-associated protein
MPIRGKIMYAVCVGREIHIADQPPQNACMILTVPSEHLAARHAGGVEADLVVTPALTIPGQELRWRFSRSSGPGGQGVNTTDSRVELAWEPGTSSALSPVTLERLTTRLAGRLNDGVLTVTASEFRSQLRNRDAARARLAALVREGIAPPPAVRRPTRPSAAARRRRLEDKRRHSEIKRLRRSDPGA